MQLSIFNPASAGFFYERSVRLNRILEVAAQLLKLILLLLEPQVSLKRKLV